MSELEETRTFICSHCHSDVEVDVVSAKALTKIKDLERQLEEAHKRNKKAFLDGFAYGENNAWEIVYKDPKRSGEDCLEEWSKAND